MDGRGFNQAVLNRLAEILWKVVNPTSPASDIQDPSSKAGGGTPGVRCRLLSDIQDAPAGFSDHPSIAITTPTEGCDGSDGPRMNPSGPLTWDEVMAAYDEQERLAVMSGLDVMG